MDLAEYERLLRDRLVAFEPWRVEPSVRREGQDIVQAALVRHCGAVFGADCYIAPSAVVLTRRFVVGAGSFVAAGAVIRDDVEIGRDCSINERAHLAGRVRIGDGVRIAPGAGLYGFDHAAGRTDVMIKDQGITVRGIEIGEGTWIGANAVITDGVRIGAHCIVGAGAVVTRSCPDHALVGGNPAKVINDRRNLALLPRLRSFNAVVREEIPAIVGGFQRRTPAGLLHFIDETGADRQVRPLCDAVEICAMFDLPLPGLTPDEAASLLQAAQDPQTGIVSPELASAEPRPVPGPDARLYDTMIAHYALGLLSRRLPNPVHGFCDLDPASLREGLGRLDWKNRAWQAGDWIDCYASCLLANPYHPETAIAIETLFDWLDRNCDPATGMWGSWSETSHWLQPVNGFYRLARGTYAQFGRPLPYPDRTIDTVLSHAADTLHFGGEAGDACNILDVIHPLWLCHKQTDHRRAESEQWARARLPVSMHAWIDGGGFAFDPASKHASLQGTEMWLTIIYLMADLLRLSGALTYYPKGVHRLAPAKQFDPRAVYRPAPSGEASSAAAMDGAKSAKRGGAKVKPAPLSVLSSTAASSSLLQTYQWRVTHSNT